MATKDSDTPEQSSEEAKKDAPKFKVVFNRFTHQQQLRLKNGQSTFVPPRSKTPPIPADNLPDSLPAGLNAVDAE